MDEHNEACKTHLVLLRFCLHSAASAEVLASWLEEDPAELLPGGSERQGQ